MKTVYNLSEERLLRVINATKAGIFAASPSDPVDTPQFLANGSYRVHAWEIGDPATCAAWVVNGRALAMNAEDVNVVLDRLFREHVGSGANEPFAVEIVPGVFSGALDIEGWTGTFKTSAGKEYAVFNGVVLRGFVWVSAI